MLKQGLKQTQTLKLSPQQIQLMKLLQVPTAQLEQRIKEELEVNPALEESTPEIEDKETKELAEESSPAEEQESQAEEDEIDVTEYMSDDEIADYRLQDNNYPDPDEDRTPPIAIEESFHEYLLEQIGLLELDEKQQKIAEQIVGSIDDDGYLRREIESIVDDLAFSQGIQTTVEEVEEVLKKIQEMDPPGTGARNLQECLLIQLLRMDQGDERIRVATEIIKNHFDHFTRKHYDRLQKIFNIGEEQLKEVLDVILHLNPKPGSGYSSGPKSEQYVVPDFFIMNNNGQLQLQLNGRNAPELRISREFREMLEAYDKSKHKTRQQKDAISFIKQKIDSAKWFIDAIRQRQHTLTLVMQAILDYQKDFFTTGDETRMRPMILKDIAEKTGLDISTVSRVANSKYVQTEFGIFPLKHFFSEALSTDTGEEVSTREVKKILSDIIASENKKKPYSDQKLTRMLNEKGYNIARRTVAKYREQLGIPVARLRKEL
ncbi:MAG: RNA polymerase sigma-54 factor [Chitinophagales bacterium]|nr:MAG: RNA polymerase sigma-54 factor [Chitinophagales bacterium]